MAEDFAKTIKNRMMKHIPKGLKRGTWKGKEYDHILEKREDNFIDGRELIDCSIKGTLFAGKKIKYHNGASHLNSSQVMCINYFKKFFEKEEYEKILLKILKEFGVALDGEIVDAVFEYEPVPDKEGTNFDFYMKLLSGKRVSFEIKYTEAEFGGMKKGEDSAEIYKKKWNDIYKEMVEKCPYLTIGEEAFYQNYQVNRNIVYAGKEDFAIFITPKENKSKRIVAGRAYIDSIKSNGHILNIYWKDLADKTLEHVADNAELNDYYLKFYKKYISILNERDDKVV